MTAVQSRAGRAGNLSRKVAGGIAWLFGQTLSARLIGLLSQIVLARLLFPADYAVLALAGTVSTVVAALTDFGIGEVALQRHTRVRFWTGTVFWLTLALAAVGMVLVLAVAPLAAAFYKSPTLTSALWFIAISLPLSALSSVPILQLNSQLRFKTLAAVGVLEIAAQQIGTIALAYADYGAMSFFIPLSVTALFKALFLWAYVRPKLRAARKSQFVTIFRRSLSVLGAQLATLVVAQGDYAVLGLSGDKPMIGAYYFAFRLSVQPVTMIGGSLSRVLLPTLISLRDDTERQDRAALRAARVLGFLVMPFCAVQAALAPAGTELVFGPKWRSAVLFIQILSVGLAFDAVSWIASALLRARGRFDLAFRYALYIVPIFFSMVTIGLLAGNVTGVAISVSIFYMIMAPAYSFMVFRRSGLGGVSVMQLYIMPFLLSSLSVGAVYIVVKSFVTDPFVELFSIGLLAPLALAVMVRLFAPQIFREIGDLVASLLERHLQRIPRRGVGPRSDPT